MEIHAFTIYLQANGTLQAEKLGEEDTKDSVVITNTVYVFGVSNNELEGRSGGACDGGVCRESYSFTWRKSRMCRGRFFCQRLDGNVCGDFGVQVINLRVLILIGPVLQEKIYVAHSTLGQRHQLLP